MILRMAPLSNFRLLSILLFFSVAPARADWESKFTSVSSTHQFPTISGKVYARADRIRVDSPYPFEMSLYAKRGSKRVYAGVHSFRIRLSTDADSFSGQLPACLSESFDACVTTLKLKKVGSEKCDERTCEIFEGKPKWKGIQSIRVWHWKGEKEAIFSKSIIRKTKGGEITTTFTEIEKKTRPASFFEVPTHYKDAGSLERFIGDFQGKSDP